MAIRQIEIRTVLFRRKKTSERETGILIEAGINNVIVDINGLPVGDLWSFEHYPQLLVHVYEEQIGLKKS